MVRQLGNRIGALGATGQFAGGPDMGRQTPSEGGTDA